MPEFAFEVATPDPGDEISWRYTFTMTHAGVPATATSRVGMRAIRERVAEMKEWCQDQFGNNRLLGDWDHTPYGIFYFDNEDAAFAFRMRWC